MVMWMPELRRQLGRLEAVQAARGHETGDPMKVAFDRMWDGVPNDEDIDLIIQNPHERSNIEHTLNWCLQSTASRQAQLAESPSFRLAADVFAAKGDEDRHRAMDALRHLGRDGQYETPDGLRTARPVDVGLARVLLRFVATAIERGDAWEAEQRDP